MGTIIHLFSILRKLLVDILETTRNHQKTILLFDFIGTPVYYFLQLLFFCQISHFLELLMGTFFASNSIWGVVITTLALLVMNALLGYLGIAISDHVNRKKHDTSSSFFFEGLRTFIESVKKETKGGEKIVVMANGKKLGETTSRKDITMFLPGFFVLSLVGFLIFVSSFKRSRLRQREMKKGD